MTLVWLFPIGLVALAALLVPPLLHLTRRLEVKPQAFAALRWLRERVRPRRRVRFVEIPLLLWRLLLLALIALLMAQPVLRGQVQRIGQVVLVSPEVPLAAARASLDLADARWLWLAPGFPPVTETPGATEGAFASLLREFDAAHDDATAIAVIVPREIRGLDGERLRLRHDVAWHVVDAPAAPRDASAPHSTPRTIALRYAPESAAAERYVRAAVAAWNIESPGAFVFDAQALPAPLPANDAWLMWLGAPRDAALDAWIVRGGTALIDGVRRGDEPVIARRDDGAVIARAAARGRGRLVLVTAPLLPSRLPELLDARFATQLRAWFGDSPKASIGHADAVRPVHDTTRSAAPPQRPLAPLFALIIALVFLIERAWSGARRAEAS
jgi:hypothetical protein